MMDKFGDEKTTYTQKLGESRVVVEDEVCCFGMVIGLQIKLSNTYSIQKVPVSLDISGDSRTLLDSDTKDVFGTLHRNDQKILGVLQREVSLELFADRNTAQTEKSWESPLGTNSKPKKSALQPPLELFAVLFGPATLFELVGAFAARCHLHLQHPRHCRRNVPYRNPHCLSPEDDRTIYTLDLDNILGGKGSSESETFTNPIDLFADCAEQDDLSKADPPDAIRTELYAHQKQALTFMIQREHGWAMDGHRKDIWKEVHDASGRSLFHNIISGTTQTRSPDQFRGGLLIDAPGLGKSLSVIALLASGFERQSQRHYQNSPLTSFSSTTLLVVPTTLIQLWKDEIQKHLQSSDSLAYCVYFGKDRIKYLEHLENYALVITTYSIVCRDWKSWLADSDHCLTLHSIKWGRIVLDEAHIIREPTKSFAKSTYALGADRRWAVTATPIQNRLMDLFSLFKFLRCSPFDDKKVFDDQVTHSWKTRSDPDSIAKLKTLVNCLSLRRPKTTIELPPRTDNTVCLDFSLEEWQDYQQVRNRTIYNLDNVGKTNGGVKFVNALKWVNELRLMCIHGRRNFKEIVSIQETNPAWSSREAQVRFNHLDEAGLAYCSTCNQDLFSALSSEIDVDHEDEPWIGESLELWCSQCFKARGETAAKAFRGCHHLPRCSRKQGARGEEDNVFLENGSSGTSSLVTATPDNRLPTKVRKLLQDLHETPGDTKSVVFSSWTKTFDIIQPQLQARSIRCVRLDGTLSPIRRANVLRTFRTDPDIRVLLATISCGGIGLDLTAASRAYIMEPQWNPMSESQALDRLYRHGQLKEVTTTRYIMRGSWEEQVLNLQRRKQALADLTLNGARINRADLTVGRLQYLKELVG